MFIPASFREGRVETLHELMQAHPLGLLVTHGSDGLQASPVPFLLYADEGECGVLRAASDPHQNPRVADLIERCSDKPFRPGA